MWICQAAPYELCEYERHMGVCTWEARACMRMCERACVHTIEHKRRTNAIWDALPCV